MSCNRFTWGTTIARWEMSIDVQHPHHGRTSQKEGWCRVLFIEKKRVGKKQPCAGNNATLQHATTIRRGQTRQTIARWDGGVLSTPAFPERPQAMQQQSSHKSTKDIKRPHGEEKHRTVWRGIKASTIDCRVLLSVAPLPWMSLIVFKWIQMSLEWFPLSTLLLPP